MKYFSKLSQEAKLLIAITGAAIFYAILFFLLVQYSYKRHEQQNINKLPHTETVL